MHKLILLALIASLNVDAAPVSKRKPAQEPPEKVESEFEGEIDDEEDDGSFTENAPESITQTDLLPDDEKPKTQERQSSDSGKKLYDWSKYKGEREIDHPLSQKGLTRITKEGEYMYKVDESPQKRAAGLRIGVFTPTELENPDQSGQPNSSFEENYDQTSNPAIMFDYEWQLLKSAIGKWSLKTGGGIYIAQGNGHFVTQTTNQPREIFTFWALPITVGAVYRMQLWDRQLFIPYAEGGGMLIPFGEFRDDDKPAKWGGAYAAHYAGGLAFNLTYFSAIARAQLDREYGINRIYLTAEYRGIIGLSRYDFSADFFNGGFLMEF